MMLSTEKITNAFNAICEVAESLKKQTDLDKINSELTVIISIAKHQNDIRNAAAGGCRAHAKST